MRGYAISEKDLPASPDPNLAAISPPPDANYRIGCPDLLEIAFADHPEWDAAVAVDLDGRVALDHPGSPRAEGLTVDELRNELARMANVSPDRVRVWLVAPRSSRIYLYGPIRGRSRAVPYNGEEPVIDFLKRVGGLPPGSKLNQVYVVRPNLAAGGHPEVFRVDVEAVLLDRDGRTNIRLQPSDQVYIGETRCSSFSRILPKWARPAIAG